MYVRAYVLGGYCLICSTSRAFIWDCDKSNKIIKTYFFSSVNCNMRLVTSQFFPP